MSKHFQRNGFHPADPEMYQVVQKLPRRFHACNHVSKLASRPKIWGKHVVCCLEVNLYTKIISLLFGSSLSIRQGIPWLTHLNHRSIKFHLVRFIMNPSIFIFLHILILKPLWPLITLRLRFKRLHIAGSFVGPLGINGVYCAEYLGSQKNMLACLGVKHTSVCVYMLVFKLRHINYWRVFQIWMNFERGIRWSWILKRFLVFPGILNSGSKETQRRSQSVQVQ